MITQYAELPLYSSPHVSIENHVSPFISDLPGLSSLASQDLFEDLAALEKGYAETQKLVQLLTARLDGQLFALSSLRERVSAMVEAPTVSPAPPRDDEKELKLHCLGTFMAFRGHRRLPLRSGGKESAILKYLAVMGSQPIQRDVLIETFWPDTNPQAANNRLKVAMHHLRQAMGPNSIGEGDPDYVLYQSGCYLLNPNVNIWTDFVAFADFFHVGAKLERARRLDEAIQFYMRAEALYRGDLLEEDLLEDWTLVRREGLKDTYLMILDKLSQYWFQAGHIERAISGWKKIVLKDPWREDAYRNLMLSFTALGQRARALKWYETCVQTLRAQLSIEPEPETIELFDCIRQGAIASTAPLF